MVEFDLDGLPDGAVVTAPGLAGVDDDSDIDPATGRTGPIDVPMGVTDLTWDAGFFVPYDLVVAKTLTTALVSGDEATYEIGVANTGLGVAYGPITVVDEFPPGLTPTSAAGGDGWSCTISGQTATCVYAEDLQPGHLSVITMTAQVVAAGGVTIVNSAEAFGQNPEVLGGNLSNDAASAEGIVVAQEPDLPRTGQDLDRILLLGVLTLLLGGAVAALGKRRRPDAA